jgi:hypothetical protein
VQAVADGPAGTGGPLDKPASRPEQVAGLRAVWNATLGDSRADYINAYDATVDTALSR